MERDPYTYVTMSLSPGGPTYLGVSFHSPELRVRASVLTTGRPYLDISSNTVTVTVSTTAAGPVTTADLDIARQIHRAAARYLADCERLHHEQSANSGAPACDGSAA
ncbi:hypothetical protein [Microtetraspora niveoalba]|uniref:hypothetical protein n=1 Tax=Microtetraspora niveoalba TaxID=46175 RepID=UPI00082A7A51|nr:hypothetical protein [Microtetraspora niveoalba]